MTAESIPKARYLRKQSTEAEKTLWRQLRNRELAGCKFRRQAPIGKYIVDFLCYEQKLVIEIDGGQHQSRVEADSERTDWLETQGYRVVRFWNNQVLAENRSSVRGNLARTAKGRFPLTLTLSRRERGQEVSVKCRMSAGTSCTLGPKRGLQDSSGDCAKKAQRFQPALEADRALSSPPLAVWGKRRCSGRRCRWPWSRGTASRGPDSDKAAGAARAARPCHCVAAMERCRLTCWYSSASSKDSCSE